MQKGAVIGLLIGSVVANKGYPRVKALARENGWRVWTVEELAQHDGRNPKAPLLLSILGEVYDVGPGARFYGPSGGYSHMAGCDNSRSYTDTSDDEEFVKDDMESQHGKKKCDSRIRDLKRDNINDVMNWFNFYREHKEYRFVGVLHDRYFGADGALTYDGHLLEEMRRVGKQAQEMEKDINKRFMPCNSKHESSKPYAEFWCSDGYHPKGSLPVHFYYQLPQHDEKGRCACVPARLRAVAAKEAENSQPDKARFRFAEYKDCEKPGQMCRRPKGATPPV